MKNLTLFLFVFVAVKLHSGIRESFSDANFSDNPTWVGAENEFKVNQNLQLQSCAVNAGTYSIFTTSNAIVNGFWEFSVKIEYATSASNYAIAYIVSDQVSLLNGLNGYYVQIGNTNDEVSLYYQKGNTKTLIIDGTDKRTDGKSVEMTIRITRDKTGRFELFSKLKTETEFFKEGDCIHNAVQQSDFFGLSYSCTSSTGSFYSFDDVIIDGSESPDSIKPVWLGLTALEEKKLIMRFSEPVKYSNFQLKIDEQTEPVLSIFSHPGDTLLEVTPEHFPMTGKRYKINVTGITDKRGNKLADSTKILVLSEPSLVGDFYFNEIMFNPNDSAAEYLEIFNLTEKILDLSGLIITTMKTDGSYYPGKSIPVNTWIEPLSYIVLTKDSALLRKFHQCPDTVKIIQMDLYAFSNESGTVTCFDKACSLVYDEFYWNDNMHHVLIHNTRGISLEKAVANIPSKNKSNWHSSATLAVSGTPGYRNSQYIEVMNNPNEDIQVEKDYFTPDNDGNNDLFLVKLRLDNPGYMVTTIVFSHSGQKVKNIMQNQLGSTENIIYWDGSNNSGQIVSPGIYLMLIDYFHPNTGKRRTSSIPIAVAFR